MNTDELIGIGLGGAAAVGQAMYGQSQANQNQQQQMQDQRELMELSSNLSYQNWLRTNYAAQIEQMKKAGLSPALMYGQAGAGGGTVSGAQGQGTSQPTDRSVEMKLRGQEMGCIYGYGSTIPYGS